MKQTRNGKISNPIHILEKVGLSKWVGIDVFWTLILSSGLVLSRPCLLKYSRFLIEFAVSVCSAFLGAAGPSRAVAYWHLHPV